MKFIISENKLKKVIKKSLTEGPHSFPNQPQAQNRSKVIASAYYKTIDAVKGVGTNKQSVLSALKMLQNQKEFKIFLSLFKDRKTGYSSFQDMINGEYDQFDYDDVFKLIKQIETLGFKSSMGEADNIITGSRFVEDSFKLEKEIDLSLSEVRKDKMTKCKSVVSPKLPEAIKFWRDWLSNPITITKVKNNYNIARKNQTLNVYYLYKKHTVESAFKKYEDLLKSTRIIYYNNSMSIVQSQTTMKSAQAFVTEPNGKIYYNCSYYDTQDSEEIVRTLIHEIQHMIYDILPLNPEKKLSDVFVKPNTNLESPEQIKYSSVINTIKQISNKTKYSKEIINASKKIGIEPSMLFSLELDKKNKDKKQTDKGYWCRETENMSKIFEIRKLFGLKPGQDITLNMIKPYLNFTKTSWPITMFLYCWIEKGYPDLNTVLYNVNQLAAKNYKQNKLYA